PPSGDDGRGCARHHWARVVGERQGKARNPSNSCEGSNSEAARMLKRLTRSEGFTLVETLVASVVLIVGLLGTFSFLAAAVTASWLTRAREGAVTLARQTTEDARSIPFAQLSPGTITAQLQAMPGLASSSTTSWQIVRRGITYTLTAKECSVDDP